VHPEKVYETHKTVDLGETKRTVIDQGLTTHSGTSTSGHHHTEGHHSTHDAGHHHTGVVVSGHHTEGHHSSHTADVSKSHSSSGHSGHSTGGQTITEKTTVVEVKKESHS